MSDYSEVFGREPEAWRLPLGALRITLYGDPEKVDVRRAQHEVEELVRVLNEPYTITQEQFDQAANVFIGEKRKQNVEWALGTKAALKAALATLGISVEGDDDA